MRDLWAIAGSLTAIIGYNAMLGITQGWHLDYWAAHGLSFAAGMGCAVLLIVLRRMIAARLQASLRHGD